MATDEVVATQVVEVESYETRKGRTWEFIKSDPSKWEAAQIKGIMFVEGHGDVPIYHIGSIIKTRLPDQPGAMNTFSVQYVENGKDYTHVKTPNTTLMGGVCELCGHGIRFEHILIDYSEKKYMVVGSECIGHHHGAVVRKAIKTFKDNKIRQEFTELREKILPFLETKKDKSSDWAMRINRLEYWAWKAKMSLIDIDPATTGSRKLSNRIKDMRKFLAKGGEPEEAK